MSLLDGINLADQLRRLVQSPRVQTFGNALRGQLPYASGPLMGRNNSGMGQRSQSGATPNIGQALNGMITALGSSMQNQQQTQPSNPLTELFAQLVDQLQQPVAAPTDVDREDLMNQVQSALNPIYDQRISAAKGNYNTGSADIKGMYSALSDEYKKMAPQAKAQADQAEADVADLYGQLRTNITGDFARVSKEQGDLFNQLGIGDALPSVLDEQDDSVKDALKAASENQANEQAYYLRQGNTDQTYYQEQAPNAILAGNEFAGNLLNQLNQYVNQTNAERTSGIQTAYMDQLNNAQNQLFQQQQAAQGENSRRQGMLWDMLQGMMTQQSKASSAQLTPDSFLSQLPPELQQSVAGAYTQLQRSPEAVYGKVEDPRNPVPGTFVNTTPQWYMSQVDEMYKNGQIDAQTYQNLQMYLQLAMGKPGGYQ